MRPAPLAPDLRLDIALIDEQHGHFFNLINRMLLRDPKGDPRCEAGQILDELSDYVYEHFRTEEDLMEMHDFPGLAAHRKQHADFVGRVIDFNRRFRRQEPGLEDEMLVFLVTWLTAHIRQEDRKYASYFAEIGV